MINYGLGKLFRLKLYMTHHLLFIIAINNNARGSTKIS